MRLHARSISGGLAAQLALAAPPAAGSLLPTAPEGAGASFAGWVSSFFDLSPDQKTFVVGVSRGIQAAYFLAAELGERDQTGGLEHSPAAATGALKQQLALAIAAVRKAYDDMLAPSVFGAPCQFKIPFRLYNFLYQNQDKPGFDAMLQQISDMTEAVEVISNSDYERLPKQTAAIGFSGFGAAPAAGVVIIVVAIAVAVVVVAWSVSSSVKAKAAETTAFADTVDKMRACVETGHCTQAQLDELMKHAPKQTDWTAIVKWGVVGVGVLAGTALLLGFRTELRAAGAAIRGRPAAAVSGLNGLRFGSG